jgi:hypothetical protein|nr:MAG TPA: hypothetical protein [Caudoviricetes sp.]
MKKKDKPVVKEYMGGLSEGRDVFSLTDEDIALIEHRVFTERIPLDEAVKDFPRTTPVVSNALKAHHPELHKRLSEESRAIRKELRREVASEPWQNDSCILFWSPRLLTLRGYLKASGANNETATSNQ